MHSVCFFLLNYLIQFWVTCSLNDKLTIYIEYFCPLFYTLAKYSCTSDTTLSIMSLFGQRCGCCLKILDLGAPLYNLIPQSLIYSYLVTISEHFINMTFNSKNFQFPTSNNNKQQWILSYNNQLSGGSSNDRRRCPKIY